MAPDVNWLTFSVANPRLSYCANNALARTELGSPLESAGDGGAPRQTPEARRTNANSANAPTAWQPSLGMALAEQQRGAQNERWRCAAEQVPGGTRARAGILLWSYATMAGVYAGRYMEQTTWAVTFLLQLRFRRQFSFRLEPVAEHVLRLVPVVVGERAVLFSTHPPEPSSTRFCLRWW